MIDNVNDYQANGEPAADRWATALHLFDEQHEENAAEKWERAQLLFDARDYRSATPLLTEILAGSPRELTVRLLLARCYYHTAQLNRAEEQLRAIIDQDPGEHYAYLMIGRTLERRGRHDEARPWLRMSAAFAGEPA